MTKNSRCIADVRNSTLRRLLVVLVTPPVCVFVLISGIGFVLYELATGGTRAAAGVLDDYLHFSRRTLPHAVCAAWCGDRSYT